MIEVDGWRRFFTGSQWITGSQIVCYLGTKGRRSCCCWSRNLFQSDFPARKPTSVQMIFDHNRTAFHFSLHFLSVIQKKSYKNTSTLHSMKEFVNFLKKVLLHKWSCMTLLFPRSLCWYLSSGSLFLDKDHEGDSQYWGLTVGGQTGARFAQRKVQIKSGQSVQGVQEFRRCQGTAAANGGGGGGCGGSWERMKLLRFCPWRGTEVARGRKHVTTTRGGVWGGGLMAILAQGWANLI